MAGGFFSGLLGGQRPSPDTAQGLTPLQQALFALGGGLAQASQQGMRFGPGAASALAPAAGAYQGAIDDKRKKAREKIAEEIAKAELKQRQAEVSRQETLGGLLGGRQGFMTQPAGQFLQGGNPQYTALQAKLSQMPPEERQAFSLLSPKEQEKVMREWLLPSQTDPSMSAKDFALYESLQEDDKKTGGRRAESFMNVIRRPQTFDLGNAIGVVNPQDPMFGNPTLFPKGLPPEKQPAYLQEGAAATAIGQGRGEQVVAKPEATQRAAGAVDNLERLAAGATELASMPGLETITGSAQGRLPDVAFAGSSEGSNALAKYNSITSEVFVSALQNMRELSKTGGAVGNVTDKEGDRLQNSLDALGREQDTEKFRNRLKFIAAQVQRSQALIKQAYRDTYGTDIPAAQTPGQPPGEQPSRVRVVNPQTGETLEIDAADLPDAQAEGFRPQ